MWVVFVASTKNVGGAFTVAAVFLFLTGCPCKAQLVSGVTYFVGQLTMFQDSGVLAIPLPRPAAAIEFSEVCCCCRCLLGDPVAVVASLFICDPSRGSRVLGAILNARARRGVAWTHEIPHVQRVLDTMQRHRIKPHENELRFVRQLVDRGKFDHSWLPVDPNANAKRVRNMMDARAGADRRCRARS